MRIAINTLALYKTKVGMGRYIVELVNRSPEKDIENNYIVYVSEQNKKFFRNTVEDKVLKNITFKIVPQVFSSPMGKIVWEQIFLPFSLRKNNLDLYHGLGFVLPLCNISKTKMIVTIADMTFFSHPQHHIFLKNIYFKYMIPRTLEKAEKIITISENTKKEILKNVQINSKNIHNIYLGANSTFSPQEKTKTEKIKEKYNIKKSYILFVGMLEPRKNIPGLLKAFAAVKKKEKEEIGKNDKTEKDHCLVIVGKKGWFYEEIFALVKKLQLEAHIIFTGYVPDEDLPSLYTEAECFVYPSFYEGFGIPIIEAMACGCPVITSKNSSMEEIAGDAAITINPHQTEEITKAIEKILNSKKEEKEKIKAQGIEHAKKFTWEKMAEETVQIYRETLKCVVDKEGKNR